MTDKLEIHFIQIPKFKKEENGMKTKLQQWMQFISQTNPKGVELAMKENKEIRRAKEEYEFLTGKEAERRIAFLRDKAIKDENNIRKRAKEEGERKKQIEIAKELLKLGIKIEDIEKATKLTKEEIQKL